jgi:hypothetical protein
MALELSNDFNKLSTQPAQSYPSNNNYPGANVTGYSQTAPRPPPPPNVVYGQPIGGPRGLPPDYNNAVQPIPTTQTNAPTINYASSQSPAPALPPAWIPPSTGYTAAYQNPSGGVPVYQSAQNGPQYPPQSAPQYPPQSYVTQYANPPPRPVSQPYTPISYASQAAPVTSQYGTSVPQQQGPPYNYGGQPFTGAQPTSATTSTPQYPQFTPNTAQQPPLAEENVRI